MVPSIPQVVRKLPSSVVPVVCIVLLVPLAAMAQPAEPIPEQATEPAAEPLTTPPVPEPTAGSSMPEPSPDLAPPPDEAAPTTTTPEQPLEELPQELPDDSTTTSTIPGATTTVDGAADEGRSSGSYSSQPPFVPDSVDPVKVEGARQKLAQANQELIEASELIEVRKQSLDSINSQVDELASETSEVINQSADLRNDVHNMAVANFRNPSLGFPKPVIEEPSNAIVYRRLVAFMATRNDEIAAQFDLLNSQLSEEERKLVAETSRISGEQDQAKVLHAQRALAVEQAEIELATFEAAGEFFVPNAVFPVGPGVTFPLINSYGFDRARGTADSHWHEGIDIFGPKGTDLYAAEAGVITNVGSGRLGGLVVSLVGDSGTRWYYAHLDGFAPGLAEGQVVQAGELIGYLGDTGNARGTDPHLHLEMHPAHIRVINPYPQLNVLAGHNLVKSEQNQTDGTTSDENVSIR